MATRSSRRPASISGGDHFYLLFPIFIYYSQMLTQKVRSDMTAAMKARESIKVDTLRGALTAFTNELVAKGKKPTEELDDKDAITVLKRLAKQRKEAAEQYEKGGRAELAEKEKTELKIIEEYLPQMASREDIERVVREKMAGIDKADKAAAGKLVGTVMKELGGSADGTLVKEVIESLLQ